MLPLSHIYVATRVSKKKSPLLVFGSVLPDISWTSRGEIGRDQIHYAPNKLYEYILNNNFELLDLAVGVRLHSNINRGADFYSDGENYSGFAYIQGVKIEPDVAKLLGNKSDIENKVLSHNFIEAATDLNLMADNIDTLNLYRLSIERLDFEKVSSCLAKYLDLDSKLVLGEVKQFLQSVGPDSYKTEKSLADKMTLLIKTRMRTDVDTESVFNLLKKSKSLMKNVYKKYLDEAVESMKIDFSDLL